MNSFSKLNAVVALFRYKRLVLTGVFLFFVGFFAVLSFSHTHEAEAFSCTAVAGTNSWNSPSAWTGCNSSYPGSPGNGNADTVTIPDSAVVMTANTSVTVASITYTSGTSAASISISGGVTLTVSGTVTINAPTASVNKQMIVGAGTLISNGITLSGGGSAGRNAILSATTGIITTTNGITFSGTAAQAQLTTTGAATINLTGTVSSGGTASINSATTLVSTGTSAINLDSTWGILSIPSGTLTLGNVNVTFAGAVSISGTLGTVASSSQANFGSSITVNSGGSLNLGTTSRVSSFNGNIVMNGTTFNSGLNTATLTGTIAISGSSNVTFGGNVTVTGTVTNNSGAIVIVSGSFTGAGSWTQGSSSYLRLIGTGTNANAVTTFDASSNSNTVDYNYGSNQTLKAVNYHNLVLSNAGTKTMTGVSAINGTFVTSGSVTATTEFTTLGGDMTIGGTSVIAIGAAVSVPNLYISGGTLTTGAFAFTVDGITSITTGTFNVSNNTGTKTLTGQITLSGGTLSGSSSQIVLVTGITNNGGSVSISGTTTISTAGFVFSGSSAISITNIVVNSPGTVTNNGNVTVGTLLSGTGSWTQGTNSVLTANGTTDPVSITTFDASSNVNTVNYSGTFVTQNCKEVQYYHIGFGGWGSRNCLFAQPILGDFTLSGGILWSNASGAVEVNGNFTATSCSQCFTQQAFTVHGTSQINIDFSLFNNSFQTYDGDVTFSGGGLRSSYGTSTVTFGANVINNGAVNLGLVLPGTTIFTSDTATISGTGPSRMDNIQINGSATLTNNTTISSYGNSSVNGTGTFVMGSGSTYIYYGSTAPTITSFDASSNPNTINYASSSQTARVMTYHSLTLSGSGSTNLTGITTLNGDFTVSGSGSTSAPFTTVGGSIITSGTVTVTLTAGIAVGGSINVGSTTTLVAPSGTMTIGNDFTRSGTFTHNSGTVVFNNVGETTLITGNPTFNNFSVTTAGKTIQVASGDTLTIVGALTLTGTSGNNVILTSSTGSSSFNMTFQNPSNAVTYTTVSWSACVSSYDINVYDGTSTNDGNNGACWLFAAPGSATISGTATGNDAATVKVAVNGAISGSTGTITSNAWSITNVVVPSGATVVVWVDNVAEANESNAITKYDGEGDITGMVLTSGVVTIGSVDNPSLTIPDFNTFDTDTEEDLLFSAGPNSMFAYGNQHTNPTLNILSGSDLTVGASESLNVKNITIAGSLVNNATAQISVQGSWVNNGTFTVNNGTVIFSSLNSGNSLSGNLEGVNGKFYNLLFEGQAGSWSIDDDLEVANNFVISSGTVSSPSNLTISGSLYNFGTFDSSTGEVILNTTSSGKIINGVFTGSSKFNDLTFNGVGGEWTTNGDIQVDGDLTLTAGTVYSNTNLTVNGGTIDGNGSLVFSSNLNTTGTTYLASGPSSTCSIDIKTYVYCWASNYSGMLGINEGGNGTKYTPVRVLAGAAVGEDTDGTYLKNIKYLEPDFSHTCAVAYSGNIYCWGESNYGALGIGSGLPDQLVPARVLKGAATGSDTDGTYLINVKTLATSNNNSCAVTNSGNTYCWGYTSANGDGFFAQRNTPVKVLKGEASGNDTDGTYLINVRQISGGDAHHCVVTYENVAYCWGSGNYGQMGVNSNSAQSSPVKVLQGVASGEDTDSTYLINISSIEAGQNATCAVMISKNFYCWGRASGYYLGDGQQSVDRWTPVRVLAGAAAGADTDGTYLVNVVESSPTYSHNCARTDSEAVYCWGTGGSGQLGDNGFATRTTPVRVLKGDAQSADTDGTNLTNIKKVSGGNGFTCAASNSGVPYCWGNRGYAGDNQASADRGAPVGVQSYTSQFMNISVGGAFTCGVHNRGTIYCWGHSFFGSLGDGTDTIRRFPAQVVKGEATGGDTDGTYLTNIKQAGTGSTNSCALSHSGAVYCWGYYGTGQNGDGQTVTSRLSPVRVLAGQATGADTDGTYLTNIRQLSMSGGTTCAVSFNNYAYCWGSEGGVGALGDNTASATRSTPVRVQDGEATGSDTDGTYLINVNHISAGGSHVCAVTNSSNAYCWGNGSDGRVGDNTGTSRYTPVHVVKGAATGSDTDGTYLTNIRQISAVQLNTCALSFSGFTYCWGDTNQGGQVGDGQAGTDRLAPVKVWKGDATGSDTDGTYLVNIRKIAVGYGSVCSIAYSGNTFCWGLDRYIGVNNTNYHTAPTKMVKGSAFASDTDGTYMTNLNDISANGNGGLDGGTAVISMNGVIYCTVWTLQSISICGNNNSGTSYVPILPAYVPTPSVDVPTTAFNGTGTLGGSSSWNLINATFGETTPGTTTATGAGAINIFGDVSIAIGHTFDAGSKTITVKDDFSNSGTFNGNTGTLVFDNSGNIATILGSGVTDFNNLTISTPGKTVEFEAGEMFTINGTLTITGTLKENVVITSTATDEQWLVNHQGTESVSYATISWSGCSSSPSSDYIDVSDGTNTDGDNNGTCWAFLPIIELLYGPGGGPTGGGPGSNSVANGGTSFGPGGPPTEETGTEPGSDQNSGNGSSSGGGGGASP